MKLVIQIPCLNEADILPVTLADLPRSLPGVDEIRILIIDDGSDDETVAVARAHGVDHVVRHTHRRGLARAFQTGLEASLGLGADVIVNTDADNQYSAAAIADLVRPVLAGEADIVIGDRRVATLPYFSPLKRRFQSLGSWVVRTLSGTDVPDTTSGFRAYDREAALRLNIVTDYSYTLETILQAAQIGLRIHSVPVPVNAPTRPTRLQRSMWHFIKAQGGTILRVYAFYEPLRTFTYLAFPFLLAGLLLLARFGYFVLTDQSGIGRYAQSVSIGVGLFLTGVFIATFGIQADIAARHRRLTEEALYRLRKLTLEEKSERDDPAGGGR